MFELTVFTCSQNKALQICRKSSCWLFSAFQTNCFRTPSLPWETSFSKTVQNTANSLKVILSTLGVFTEWKPPPLPNITEKDTAKYGRSKVLRCKIPPIKKNNQQKNLLVWGLKCQAHFLMNPHRRQNTRWHSVGKWVCYQTHLLI